MAPHRQVLGQELQLVLVLRLVVQLVLQLVVQLVPQLVLVQVLLLLVVAQLTLLRLPLHLPPLHLLLLRLGVELIAFAPHNCRTAPYHTSRICHSHGNFLHCIHHSRASPLVSCHPRQALAPLPWFALHHT
jgi:hypothetical protein